MPSFTKEDRALLLRLGHRAGLVSDDEYQTEVVGPENEAAQAAVEEEAKVNATA